MKTRYLIWGCVPLTVQFNFFILVLENDVRMASKRRKVSLILSLDHFKRHLFCFITFRLFSDVTRNFIIQADGFEKS